MRNASRGCDDARVPAMMRGGFGPMVLPDRIELSTSPLPMECSTTELRQHREHGGWIGPTGRDQARRFLPQAPRPRKRERRICAGKKWPVPCCPRKSRDYPVRRGDFGPLRAAAEVPPHSGRRPAGARGDRLGLPEGCDTMLSTRRRMRRCDATRGLERWNLKLGLQAGTSSSDLGLKRSGIRCASIA
jgi:hypothetical protein